MSAVNLFNCVEGPYRMDLAIENSLCDAIMQGDTDAIQSLIKQYNIDINQFLSNGTTLLLTAITSRADLDTVRYLVKECGANVNQVVGQLSPLSLAVSNGDIDLVSYLVAECGADITRVNEDKSTFLISALRRGHSAVARFLVEQAGTPIHQRTRQGETALRIAAQRNDLDTCQLLASYGARVEDVTSRTPLREPVKSWVSRVRGQTPEWSPLHYACLSGSTARIEQLLVEGHNERALAFDPHNGGPVLAEQLCLNEESRELMLRARLPYCDPTRALLRPALYPTRCHAFAAQLLAMHRRAASAAYSGVTAQITPIALLSEDTWLKIMGLAIHRSDRYRDHSQDAEFKEE